MGARLLYEKHGNFSPSLHLFFFWSCDSSFGLDSLSNEDGLGWFSSAQPNEDTEAPMTDDIKPDTMLGNQRTLMLQVEDFLNNSECYATMVLKIF